MRIRRRKAISVLTHQVTTIRRNHQVLRRWCDQCAAEVTMVTPEGAAELIRISSRDLFRRIEAGGLHFIEIGDREVLICCVSLRDVQATVVQLPGQSK